MIKLKPCPFCGSNKIRLTEEPIILTPGFWYSVECGNSDCRANIGKWGLKKCATDAWNERVKK